jgi:hypothetical protein
MPGVVQEDLVECRPVQIDLDDTEGTHRVEQGRQALRTVRERHPKHSGALAFGAAVIEPPPDVRETHATDLESGAQCDLVFDALMRRMDRIDPAFRN